MHIVVQDKVSAVRCAATLVIAKMLHTLEPELSGFLVADLADKVRESLIPPSGSELIRRDPYHNAKESFKNRLLGGKFYFFNIHQRRLH